MSLHLGYAGDCSSWTVGKPPAYPLLPSLPGHGSSLAQGSPNTRPSCCPSALQGALRWEGHSPSPRQTLGGGLPALISLRSTGEIGNAHPGPTCMTPAKAHLPGCLWGQGLLQVRVTPETEKTEGQGHMETFYLLPITQGESCLLGASAAPSVEWGRVRLVLFRLSPGYPRVPGMWLGEDWVGGPSGARSRGTRAPLFRSHTEYPCPRTPPASGPTQQVQLLGPSPPPPTAWGYHGHFHTTMATELPEAIYCTCLPG